MAASVTLNVSWFFLTFIILPIILFMEPAYYRLKSKGYAPTRCVVPATAILVVGLMVPYLPCLAAALLAGPVLYVVARLLPARPGAPGLAYLRIDFNCPACSASLAFRRSEEGRATVCPHCGTLLTVPSDRPAVSPLSSGVLPAAVQGRSALPVVGRWVSREQAELARIRLEAFEIPVVLADSLAAGTLPILTLGIGGIRLQVPEEHAEAALRILRGGTDEACLPDDFVPGETYRELVLNDGFALAVLVFLFLSGILNVAIVAICGFPEASAGQAYFFGMLLSLGLVGLLFDKLGVVPEGDGGDDIRNGASPGSPD